MLVAVLDDDKGCCARIESEMAQAVPDAKVDFFDNAPDMIAWLARHTDDVALLSLSHDLGPSRLRDGMLFHPGNGREVTDFIVELDRQFPIIVHTRGGPGGRSMLATLERSGWPSVRVQPKKGLDWIRSEWIPRVREMLSEE